MLDYNKINNIFDMLKGNINRMMVTKSIEELDTMYKYALKRIESIYKQKKVAIEELENA